MPGDDDDIIIHRVQHNTSTDVATPVTVSNATFKALWEAIPTSAHSSQPAQSAYNSVDGLVT